MFTYPKYVRPTKASNLRALANNFRASNDPAPIRRRSRSHAPVRLGASCRTYTALDIASCSRSVFSMPNPKLFSESTWGSLPERSTESEKRPSTMSQPAQRQLSLVKTDHTPAVGTRKSHLGIVEHNRLLTVETQYQKLQCLQSDFVESLRSLDLEQSKLLGTYSFVTLVVNEDSKSIANKENSSSLVKNLPADSVQDLKERCQAAVDSGFMMLYDHLEPIQMAKDEFEACNRKELLKDKLKELLNRKMESIVENIEQVCVTPVGQQVSPNICLYRDIDKLRRQKHLLEARLLQINKDHNEQMNRLKADLEGKLKAEEENWQQTLGDLKERLRHSEAQRNENANQLAIQNASLQAKNSTIAAAKADMDNLVARNQELNQLLKGSDGALVWTRKELSKSREHVVHLEAELHKGRELINQQKKRLDVLDIQHAGVEKDQTIGDLRLKVQNLLQLIKLHQEQEQNSLRLRTRNNELETMISELQDKMKLTEIQLDANDQREEQLHSDLEIVKMELFRSEQLVVKLREHANRDRKTISAHADEINELNQTIDQLYLETGEKDTQINQVTNQLCSKEEHLGRVFEKLSRQEDKLRRLEELTNVSTNDNARLLQLRDRQHEKNIQMDWEISQLKDTIKELRDYIFNNTQPAAEVLGYQVGGYSMHPEYLNLQPQAETQGNLESTVEYLEPLNGHFVHQHELSNHQPQQRHHFSTIGYQDH
ncbi:protein Daple-like isoform X1 [Drosophila pseudoobscura]|uniref:Protein Daple-like isoform X1 n=1 Tax=Drosophila pseudoobscura pseudoobscura TaxID=46245 RepID=A0A6I8W6B0_DROPS|nr:protein Daple isoform X1 [Drosophila pseudoobscura]